MATKSRFVIEIYQTKKLWPTKRPQRWRWRAVARNHKNLASGEAYTNKVDMLDTIKLLFGPYVTIVEKT